MMPAARPSRLRAFRRCLLLCCLLALTLAALPAGAATPARQTLETSISRILNCIKNPDYVNPATRGPLRQQIEDEVLHVFDFGEFSSRTVGPRWRAFTPEQQRRFSDAFADLLINTYLNKIDGYNGEQVLYTGETVSPDGKRVEIQTSITMKDGKKVPVAYRMLPKRNSWFVYDVLIENLSLVKNYRTQFQDILNSASPDQLIEKIRAKTREVGQSGS
ncbi:Tgt2/MlaC family protein [Desulfovibrio legallii]|jgi:phospholipid transport system substrate-binding protein|uniref:Phospholipid transport system substrate-binding protein n=1 Tax=Desulfovibrio legallii TaxID=571438 RepID=A0A1G7IS08_9BACT|nr:ABC transporter substrate-binding protein [Desulfovibrio legallii]SDF15334.1 phospholipid transport system substrate-binding protein [Desulfovibrio legallii]